MRRRNHQATGPRMDITWEDVERYRDRTFRRLRSRRVRGAQSALEFVNEVGFCTAFSRAAHLPCLWVAVCGERRPRMPHHTHSDYAIGLTWELKDRLPDERRVFYARLLHGKPSLISLRLLPCFYRVFGPPARGEAGQALSVTEQGILDCLTARPPQPTWQLRLHGDFHGRLSKARFEKAMSRLQESFHVVKTRTVYEPKFTYIWGLFEKTFPRAARQASRIAYEAALERILRGFFRVALAARRADLTGIFRGVDVGALNMTLEKMVRAGDLVPRARIHGTKGDWYVWKRGVASLKRRASSA
jgi:hypothetical protein